MNLKLASLGRTRSLLTSALIAVFSLALIQGAWAQSAELPMTQASQPKGAPVLGGSLGVAPDLARLAASLPKISETDKPNTGGTHEGLKMHGHWIIDIKNPDGTLAGHHDFQNSLSASAQGILIAILTGQMTPGNFMIAMGAQTGNAPCVAVFQFCGIAQNLATSPATNYCSAYYCSGNLTVTSNYGTLFSGPYSIVFAGSITANQAGTIGTVYTIYNACANVPVGTNPTSPLNITPAGCVTNTLNNWVGPLSAAAITPVAVANGQIIQVSVTITFS